MERISLSEVINRLDTKYPNLKIDSGGNRCRLKILDSTKLKTYESCPRKFFYEYFLGWQPYQKSIHLIFGQAWHSALEFLYIHGFSHDNVSKAFDEFLRVYNSDEVIFPHKTKTPDTALLGLVEYIDTYARDLIEFNTVDIETLIEFPLPSSFDDSNEEDIFKFCAKLDYVYSSRNRLGMLEHKTATRTGQTWFDQWRNSLQVGAYLYAMRHIARQADMNTNVSVTINSTCFLTKERKLERIECTRSDDQVDMWHRHATVLASSIKQDLIELESNNSIIMDAFRMNTGNCTAYGNCPYLDLCTCWTTPIPHITEEPPSEYEERHWDPGKEE